MRIFGLEFGRNSVSSIAGRAEYERDMQERKERDELAKKIKRDWEAKNKLAKKIDACNLYMTRTAFNGTYEEYLTSRNSEELAKMQNAFIPMQIGSLYYRGFGQNFGCNPFSY